MSHPIGEKLKAQRQRLGRSIEDAAEATRIRARLLEALENDDVEALPNPAYVKGYIISYARYLDLEPDELVASYFAQFEVEPPEPRRRSSRPVVPSREGAHSIPVRGAVAAAAVLGILVIVIWGIGRATSGSDTVPPIPGEPITTATIEPETPADPAIILDESGEIPTSSTPETVTTPATSEPFSLEVRVESGAASWLRVTVDGLNAYEGTLTGPQRKEWDVTEEAVVRIGMPSAVTVLRDGDEVEIPTDANTPEMTLRAEP